jgi:hypothetical protein
VVAGDRAARLNALPAGVRRELRAALLIVAAVLAFSVLGGVVWGLLAPTEQLLVTQPGRGATLTGESLHQFDAVAIFVCIGAVVGLLSAAGVWRWRGVRGPILQIGLLIGSVVGAYAMSWVGELVAEWNHPRPDNPPVGQIVALPPELGSWLALIVQPLLASLVVLFLAALSPSEDLGTGFSGPIGEMRPVERLTAASTYGTNPYGGYEPVGEIGALPQSDPAR